jgi:multiple sugar transport system ATP-binding protein
MDVVAEGAGLPTEVDVVEELGADAYVDGSAEFNGVRKADHFRMDGRPHRPRRPVVPGPPPGHVHLFSGETGERIDEI